MFQTVLPKLWVPGDGLCLQATLRTHLSDATQGRAMLRVPHSLHIGVCALMAPRGQSTPAPGKPAACRLCGNRNKHLSPKLWEDQEKDGETSSGPGLALGSGGMRDFRAESLWSRWSRAAGRARPQLPAQVQMQNFLYLQRP